MQCTCRLSRRYPTVSRSLSSPLAPCISSQRRQTSAPVARDYFYNLTRRGELFLSTIKHRNFTSTLTRDRRFSRFFWNHLRPSTEREIAECPDSQYAHFISPCMGERNWVCIESGATPVVFVAFADDHRAIKWPGGGEVPFQPDMLKVDARSGYLYHPAPDGGQYGAYSLLRSTLVVEHLSEGLEIDQGGAGRYRWRDAEYTIAPLRPGDALLGRG